MLKSTVPTPVTTPVDAGGVASASSTNTSSSGNAKATEALQLRPISSSHWPVAESNRTMRPVLGAPGRGDEGTGMAAAREDDVARLVAHGQRARDAGARHVRRVDLDDADAVGEVIHHPDLGLPGEVRARGDRHRLEADRDLRRERKPARADRVDRQAIVRRVQREEAVAARRECEGPGMPALEVGERAAAGGSGGHEEQDGGESTRDHVPFLLVRAPERYQRPSAVTITRLWAGAACPCPR